jgi:type III pantothenate kinase
MLLALDAGNTRIKACLFDKDRNIISKDSIKTAKFIENDNDVASFLNKFEKENIEKSIISSVVTEANEKLSEFIKSFCGKEPYIISSQLPLGINYSYKNPENIGADRISNILGASSFFISPFMVCDFGTATTISLSLEENVFSGGLISPGVKTSLNALFTEASKLPDVHIDGKMSLAGNSTDKCIRGGVYYMQRFFIEGYINSLKKEYPNLKTACTGGFSYLFEDAFDKKTDELVLYGCFEAFKRL